MPDMLPEDGLLPEDFFARGHVQRAVRELDFGALFRAVREDRRWSQETLGEILELDQPRICKIESGRQRLSEQALQYLRLIHAALSDYHWERHEETLVGAILGEAWAHALMGHEEECRRLMGLAEDHYARRTANTPLPPWRVYFDETEFTGLRGHSLHVLALRQPSVAAEAHELLATAAANRTASQGKVRAMNQITVTATCFQGGDDIPGGIESARTTLELLSALDAPRVRSEARVLLDVTEPYAHHPDVADLRHDLTQALPPGPGTTVA